MTTTERDRLIEQIKAAIPVEPEKKFRLGKRPARKNAIKFALEHYVDLSKLPTPPSDFGREHLVKEWGMLGNADYGSCVFSGAAHEHMLWNREVFRDVPFDDKAVLSDYSALTGFDPNDPFTDQGTDMQAAATYRRTTGIVDANGVRHKILAYLAIEPGNLPQLYAALWMFGTVGVGVRFPDSAMEQMERGLPWSPVDGSAISGGHYVPVCAKRGGLISCVTWGQIQKLTPEFYETFCDESVVYLTDERLIDGKTLDGFDLTSLRNDLADLKPVPQP